MLSDDSDLRGPAMHSRLWRPPQGKPGLPSVERLIGGTSSMTVSLDRVSSNVAARGSTDGLSKYAGSPSCRQWCINTQQLENGGGSQG